MQNYKDTNGKLHVLDSVGFEHLLPAGCVPITQGEADKIRLPAPLTLSEIKTAKNTEINAWRLKANRGTFSHAGKLFACDELSRSDIDGANGMIANLGAMPPGWPGGWKAVDNTVLPIATVAEWKAFYGSMFASGNANFVRGQDLKTALAAATTAAQVAAIVW